MSIMKIIGENIKVLMERENMSMRRMAEVINVSHPTMSKYVNGKQAIDSEKLYLISDYFHKNFDYFFTENHSEFSLMFRADKPSANLQTIDCNYMQSKIEEYIDLVGDTDAKYIPPTYSINIVDNKLSVENELAIEKIAYEQRRLFGIESSIPINYYTCLSNIGLNILSYQLDNENLFGASSYSEESGSFIFVNTLHTISEERQIFSLIHELGHLIFHKNEYMSIEHDPFYEKTRGNIKEKVVDTFAGYFLLPRDLVQKYISERNGKVKLNEMKNYFKVSLQALYISLHKYKMISDEKYRNFWKEINQSGTKKIEHQPLDKESVIFKNEKLVGILRNLYLEDEISVNKISEILEISTIESRHLVKNWGDSLGNFEELI
ncbi:MAG: ImmA/IrrE family metallo-endopeptidase [Clostridiales bacterium]|nr:ImmA/IrrE family metallo-endopeptidase [Clostridiales bacterium]